MLESFSTRPKTRDVAVDVACGVASVDLHTNLNWFVIAGWWCRWLGGGRGEEGGGGSITSISPVKIVKNVGLVPLLQLRNLGSKLRILPTFHSSEVGKINVGVLVLLGASEGGGGGYCWYCLTENQPKRKAQNEQKSKSYQIRIADVEKKFRTCIGWVIILVSIPSFTSFISTTFGLPQIAHERVD